MPGGRLFLPLLSMRTLVLTTQRLSHVAFRLTDSPLKHALSVLRALRLSLCGLHNAALPDVDTRPAGLARHYHILLDPMRLSHSVLH